MDYVPLSECRTALPTRECQWIEAIVMVKWPYSSYRRELAVLLAEPELRTRARSKAIRVRFSGPCAHLEDLEGITVGDKVSLSLQGAQLVSSGADEDSDLCFTQTCKVQVFRYMVRHPGFEGWVPLGS